MSSRSLRVTLRVAAAALLIFAAVRFCVDAVSSFHTEEHAIRDGGFTIKHTLAVSHVALIVAFIALLFFAFSFLGSRKKV